VARTLFFGKLPGLRVGSGLSIDDMAGPDQSLGDWEPDETSSTGDKSVKDENLEFECGGKRRTQGQLLSCVLSRRYNSQPKWTSSYSLKYVGRWAQ